MTKTSAIADRVAALDWEALGAALDADGFAVAPGVLTAAECAGLAALYDRPAGFRAHVVMQRHGFGRGEYRYFDHPLPAPVAEIRNAAYPPLAAVANRWRERLSQPADFPPALTDWLARCHAGGQTRPTPLLLKYEAGDWNALHRDLYGDLVFPIQLTVLLSDPAVDFTGGEFLLMEQRPRMQSRGSVARLGHGDAVLFAVNERPVKGARGWYRTAMRHGVSVVNSGRRFTLGVIFHDAA